MLVTGKKSDSVVTKFSLKKAVNKGGIAFSQVQFAVERTLSYEETQLIKKLSEQIKLYAQNSQNAAKFDENTGKVTALND